MEINSIGTFQAILSNISTKVDGSCKISFEVNPNDVSCVNKLMEKFLIGERLFTVAVVQGEENNGVSNG